jgi:hypothetical protein
VKYECGEEQQASFKVLKQAMREALVLQTPDFTKPFVLGTYDSHMLFHRC